MPLFTSIELPKPMLLSSPSKPKIDLNAESTVGMFQYLFHGKIGHSKVFRSKLEFIKKRKSLGMAKLP
jgi:hypothetical protein